MTIFSKIVSVVKKPVINQQPVINNKQSIMSTLWLPFVVKDESYLNKNWDMEGMPIEGIYKKVMSLEKIFQKAMSLVEMSLELMSQGWMYIKGVSLEWMSLVGMSLEDVYQKGMFLVSLEEIALEGMYIEGMILGRILLFMIISVIFLKIYMDKPSGVILDGVDMTYTKRLIDNDKDNVLDISKRLFHQCMHNQASGLSGGPTYSYLEFPENHPGYLDQNRCRQLVEILKNDPLTKHRYKFTRTAGRVWLLDTWDFPHANVYMMTATFKHEYSLYNPHS